jgi:hypothetical protein
MFIRKYARALLLVASGLAFAIIAPWSLADDPYPDTTPDPDTYLYNRTCNPAGYCTSNETNVCTNDLGDLTSCDPPNDGVTIRARALIQKRPIGVCQTNPPPAVNPGCQGYANGTLACSQYNLYDDRNCVHDPICRKWGYCSQGTSGLFCCLP